MWIESEPIDTLADSNPGATPPSPPYSVVMDTKLSRLVSHDQLLHDAYVGATSDELLTSLACQASIPVSDIKSAMRSNDKSVRICQVRSM